MREIPILFSPEMVRALRARRKFVTRRLDERWMKVKAGDRLWGKEGWRPTVAHSHGLGECDCGDVNVHYYADRENRFFRDKLIPGDWTMPKAAAKGQVTCLFMPRWASRVLLEVEEDTRQERLWDMTNDEARLEGVQVLPLQSPEDPSAWWQVEPGEHQSRTPRASFRSLWSSLHTKPGERWEDNPPVYRVGRFHVIEGPSAAGNPALVDASTPDGTNQPEKLL